MNTKSILLFIALALFTTTLFTGCHSTHQEPNYQGRSGATPRIGDYYPPNTNSNTNLR